jgi:HEAT repeat protein
VPSLRATLRNAPPTVALPVVVALYEIGGPDAGEALLAGLALSDPDVGWWLEYALGHTARPESLVKALNQPEPLRRARVARSLGWAAHGPAVPALEALLTHNPEAVRLSAAWALMRIARPASSAALRQALADPSSKVVAQVARALGAAKDRQAVSALLALLADRGRPTDVLAAASEALGEIGDPQAIQPLIDSVLFVDGANHKDAVYTSLERFGRQALPALWTASLRIALGKEDIESLGVTFLAMELDPVETLRKLEPVYSGKVETGWSMMNNAEYTIGPALEGWAERHVDHPLAPRAFALGYCLSTHRRGHWRRQQRHLVRMAKVLRAGLIGVLDQCSGKVGLVADVLADLGVREALPALLRAVEHDGSLGKAIARLKDEATLPSLIRSTRRAPEAAGNSADALGYLGDARAIPVLLGLLRHREAFVTESALAALVRLKARAAAPAVAGLLRHREARVQVAAATTLGALGAAAAVPALIGLLRHPAEPVRAAAARALGDLRARSAVPALLQTLERPDGAPREAVQALGRIGDPQATPGLIGLLQRGRAFSDVFEALARLGDARAAPALIQVLSDPRQETWWEGAVLALEALRARQAIPAVRQALARRRSGSHDGFEAAAIGFLIRAGDPGGEAALRRVLEDSRFDHPEWLRQPDPPLLEALASLLLSGSATVRTRAHEVLSNLDQPELRVPLLALARRASPAVRRVALLALGHLRTPDVDAVLRAALADPAGEVRRAALEVLGTDAGSTQLLQRAAQDANPGVRDVAESFLAERGLPAGVPFLVRALRQGDVARRRLALAWTRRRPVPAVLEASVGALADCDPESRRLALDVLTRAAPASLPLLHAALKDPEVLRRRGAVEALRRIADPRSQGPALTATRDADPAVRVESLRLLGRLAACGKARYVERIAGTDREPSERAARLAGEQQDARAVPALIQRCTARRDDAVLAALIRLRDPRSLDAALKGLEWPDFSSIPDDPAGELELLGLLGDPTAVPQVQRVIRNTSEDLHSFSELAFETALIGWETLARLGYLQRITLEELIVRSHQATQNGIDASKRRRGLQGLCRVSRSPFAACAERLPRCGP